MTPVYRTIAEDIFSLYQYAKIGDVIYGSLQEAIDSVGDGKTIILLKDNDETVVVKRQVSISL